jgi:hypothetical protein
VAEVELRPPDPPLSDEGVALRPWTLDDIPTITAACDEAEIARWIHQIPSPYGAREVGYWTAAAARGRGLTRQNRRIDYAVFSLLPGEI